MRPRCDGRARSDFSNPGHTTVCTTASESGDARIHGYEALLKGALGYYVVYASQALPAAPEGPLSAGYNVFKTVEPATDQAWIDSVLCSRDMPESTTCPPGVQLQPVLPEEQIVLRIGYRQ